MLNDDELVELVEVDAFPVACQLTQVIRTGLPLESGLIALAEQSRSGTTRTALIELSRQLEQGVPLGDAIRDSSARLPRVMGVLVEAGLESGRLDSVMQYSVEQSQRAASLRQQMWASLSYPLFLIWVAISICGFILMMIVPKFTKIFDDFGTELPGLTIALIRFQGLLSTFGWFPLIFFVLITIGIVILGFTLGDTKLGQRWSTSIPLIGAVFRLATLAEFCQILAVLIEAGLPFSKSLRFASRASDDRWLARHTDQLADEIDAGNSPDSAATLADLPNSLRQVFRHANSEKIIVDALRGLSDVYAARCTVGARLVIAVAEPFAVILVMGFASTTAIAIFLPLIKLLNDLS